MQRPKPRRQRAPILVSSQAICPLTTSRF